MVHSEIMTQEEVAIYLKYSAITLAIWRSKGRGPAFVKISEKNVRYRKRDVDKWLAGRVVNPRKARKKRSNEC